MAQEGKHHLSHAAIYLVARGLPGVIAFLAIPVFTRLLSPADYGRYALVFSAVGLLNALFFQWIRLSVVRYLPAYKDDPARLKSTFATATLCLIAMLGVVSATISVMPFAAAWRPVFLPCWVVLAIQAIYELNCEYTRAILRPWRYMGLQLARSIAAITLGVALIKLGMTWWGPLLGTAAGMAIASLYVMRRDWADVRLSLDRQILKRIWQYGAPLSLTVALTVVIGTCDRFLIAWRLGEGSAGLYSVAMDFTTQTLTLLMMVIYLANFPLAVHAWEHEGKPAAQERMRYNAALLLAVGVPAVAGISLLAPGIAACFLGKSYRETAAGIIPLVAIGTFVAGFKAYHFDAAFQFAHRTLYQVWIVLFAAVMNIGLNLIAIPLWGINGAAGASLLAYLIAIALTAWLGRRHFELPFPLLPCGQVLLASGVMSAVLLPLRAYRTPPVLFGAVAGAVIVYAVTLLATDFLGLRGQVLNKISRPRRAATLIDEIPALSAAGIGQTS